MATPATQPTTPNPVSGNSLKTGFGSLTHTQGLQQMVTDIANIWAKVGNGAANQVASAMGAGLTLLTKLDGTTEWLTLHLYNSLLDGGMEFWPYGTSIAVAASVATTAGYGPARWCLKTNANQASVIDQVAGLTNTSQWAARVRRNSGQTGTGTMVYEQAYKLHEIVKLRGDYFCIAPVVKSGANWSPTSGNLTIRVACGTGSAARRGGSAYTSETTLINQTVALNGSTQALGPFVSSVIVPTTTTQMSVSFEWTPVGTAGVADDVTIDDVMGNKGSVPMGFRARHDDIAQCLAYGYLDGGTSAADISILAVATGAQNIGLSHRHPVPMIDIPALTKVGTWALTNCTGPTVDAASKHGYRLYATASGAGAVVCQTVDATTYVRVDGEV